MEVVIKLAGNCTPSIPNDINGTQHVFLKVDHPVVHAQATGAGGNKEFPRDWIFFFSAKEKIAIAKLPNYPLAVRFSFIRVTSFAEWECSNGPFKSCFEGFHDSSALGGGT